MKNKKKFIIFGIALLVIALIFAVVFANITNKDKRKSSSKNTSTLKFDYYEEASLVHRISFIYSNKKLQDVTLTLYFDSKETAKNAYKVYKEAKEYKDYEVVKNTLVMYYFPDDVLNFKTLSQDEIIRIYTDDGYIQAK